MFYRYSPLLNWNVTNFLRDHLDAYVKTGDQLELSGEPNCTNGIPWILNTFNDCVDTDVKLVGFIIGLISLFLWLCPLIPQLYENYRRKQCEGFSFVFLLFWILGDTCNMIGAVLTDQQPLQKIIAVYYIGQDMVLLSQFFYYAKIYPNRIQRNNVMTGSTIVVPIMLLGTFAGAWFLPSRSSISAGPVEVNAIGRSLQSVGNVTIPPYFNSYTDLIGYIIGIVASICYFAGRIPQMSKNYYRKSCDGLSLYMFYIIILANFTYGVSVIMESNGGAYMIRHLPWLIGSLGCCLCDCGILAQYYYYERLNANNRRADEESEGLLANAE
uniref:PQ loop repeat family protein n=1 Tax=Panagrellus redivivus TaxID=6233 RepID=A0A7E4V854_PANRE